MVYGSGVGVFATSHGAQPVGDPCIDDGVAADCQLGGFLVQFADHPCGHHQRDSLLHRGMMFGYGIAEIDIAEDVVAVVEHLLKLAAGDRLDINFIFWLSGYASSFLRDRRTDMMRMRLPRLVVIAVQCLPSIIPSTMWRTSSFPGFGAVSVTGGVEPVDKIAAFRVLRSGF